MKTTLTYFFQILLTVLALTFSINAVKSQSLLSLQQVSIPVPDKINVSLPNIQRVSFWAPDNIKIDGIPTEWGNFKAYNFNTNIFYTIANDADNIYLSVKATDPDIINKIVGGGVALIITKSGKKNAPDKISINYPVVDNKDAQLIFNLQNPKGSIPDTSAYTINEIMNNNNTILQKTFKTIVITGVPGINTLSVYNDQGIKAAGLFDKKKAYTFELAIPIKYLGFYAGNVSTFRYNIILNGCKPRDVVKINAPAGSSDEYRAGFEQGMRDVSLRLAQKYSPTNFWGEYTLALKQ